VEEIIFHSMKTSLVNLQINRHLLKLIDSIVPTVLQLLLLLPATGAMLA